MISVTFLHAEGRSILLYLADSAVSAFVFPSVVVPALLAALLLLVCFLAFSVLVRRRRRVGWNDAFRLLLENSQDVIVTLDARGIAGYVSPSLERVLGYAPEEIVGTSIFDRVHPEDVPEVREVFARSLESPGATLTVRLRYRHRQDGWRWLEVLGRNVLHVPEVAGVVVNARDVTEQVEAEVELVRHRDRLEELVAERTRELETTNRQLRHEIVERRAQEVVLEASEACFRSAFRHAPIGMALGGRDRRLRNVNRALCDLLGYDEAELLERSLGELVHPGDALRSRAYFDLLLRGEVETFRFECRYRHKEGHYVWVLLNVSAVLEGEEGVSGCIVQVLDITDRKQTETSLRRTRGELLQQTRVLDSILSATSDHICLFDRQERFCYASRALTDAIGIRVEEVIGRRWEEVPALDATSDPFGAVVRQVLSGGANLTSEVMYSAKAGPRCYECIASPLRDAAGEMISVVVSARDITERKEAEQALRQSEERFRSAFDYAPIGKALVTPDGRLFEVNEALCRIVGYSEAELLQKTFKDIAHPDDLETDLAFVRQLQEGEIDSYQMEKRYLHREGHVVWVLLSRSAVRDEQGEVVYFIGQAQDITAWKKVEEELQRSEGNYRTLFESANDALLIFEPEGEVVLQANERACELYGFNRDEFVGKSLQDLTEDVPAGEEEVSRTLEHRKRQNLETVHIRKDGWRIHLLVNASLIEYEGKKAILSINRDVTERKQAEERTRFQAQLLEAVGQAVMATDLEGTITYWNSAAEELYGWPASEAVGCNVIDVTPSDLSREEASRIMERLRKGESWAGEFTVQRRDGTPFPVLVYDSPLYDGAGTLIGIVGISSDLTERKRAQEALRESELRFRILSEAAFEAIMIHEDGLILDANRRAAELFHCASVEELIGRSVFELTAPEFRAEAQERVEANRTEPYNAILLRPDGSTFPAEMRGRPILFDGRKARVSAVRDLTEWKKAEEEIVRQRNLLQTLVDHLPGSVYVVDQEGFLVVVNKPAADFLGMEPSDLVGRKNAELFPEEISEAFDALVNQVFATGEAAVHEASLVNPFTGRREHTYTALVPVSEEAGEIIWVAGFTQDITERKETEQMIRELNTDLERRVEARTAELQAANKELEAFAYSVSHDLRSPLRAIDGFSHILLRQYADELSPEAQSYLDKVRDNSLRMGELIEGLLRFSRLGRQPLEKKRLDPAGLIREVLEELDPQQQDRSVEFEIEELPPCEADPVLLKQVYVNVLNNALKFTTCREHARIRVGAKNDKERVVYYISDNGAGFEMAYADKLFGVFQRLHRAGEYEGTGVGMAIVQRIVHRHGGEIWAEAEPDRGATFFFTLEPDPDHGLSAHSDPAGGGQS